MANTDTCHHPVLVLDQVGLCSTFVLLAADVLIRCYHELIRVGGSVSVTVTRGVPVTRVW